MNHYNQVVFTFNEIETRNKLARLCIHCAQTNTPPNVREIFFHESLRGDSRLGIYCNGAISCKYPVTPWTLFIYLHECAHAHFEDDRNHDDDLSSDNMEGRASNWARECMIKANIAIPKLALR